MASSFHQLDTWIVWRHTETVHCVSHCHFVAMLCLEPSWLQWCFLAMFLLPKQLPTIPLLANFCLFVYGVVFYSLVFLLRTVFLLAISITRSKSGEEKGPKEGLSLKKRFSD